MVKRERPAAGLGKKSRQDTCSERMLRARARIDGDAGDQELRIVADKKLRDRGDTDDHIAGSENHRAFEETGDQTVDHLKPLADEIGNC